MVDPPAAAGLGLKPAHYDLALATPADGIWFEVHPENYMVQGGPRLRWLQAFAERHPLSLHGVGMSLAADEPPDGRHLAQLARLVERFEPALVSEHLAWSTLGGVHHPDLLPFPRTDEALQRIVANIDQVQERLRRQILIENPAHYLRLDGHDHDEIDFLTAVATQSGCALLLDINNVYVSARNLGTDPAAYLDRFPGRLIREIHLAGHREDPVHGPALLIDSHDAPVSEAVWQLYRHLIERIGPRPTLIERDGNLPAFETLLTERARATSVLDPTPAPIAATAR